MYRASSSSGLDIEGSISEKFYNASCKLIITSSVCSLSPVLMWQRWVPSFVLNESIRVRTAIWRYGLVIPEGRRQKEGIILLDPNADMAG